MQKGFNGHQIITVLSNLGSGGAEYVLNLSNHGFDPNEQVVEVLACQDVTVDGSGSLPVGMGGGVPKVREWVAVKHECRLT